MVICTLILAYILLARVFQHRHAHALATNRTIDDQNGDSVTGALPSYFPEIGWSQGNQCKTCSAQPDPQQALDNTWHDNIISTAVGSVDELRVTMSFNGTAVYAYCILDNRNTYTTFTNLTFSLDGMQVGSFLHRPGSSSQSNWKWCNKCQGLAFAGNISPGNCPAGQFHDHTWSGDYALSLNDAKFPGQGGWKWCNKCQGLCFTGNAELGPCPSGGNHDHTGSGEYRLSAGKVGFRGQNQWKLCKKCQGLSYSGASVQGACPGGGVHDYTGSGDYTLVINNSNLHDTFGTSVSYLYNALVYANASIPNGKHTFVIHSPRGSVDSVVLFDYVQYTNDNDPPTSANASSSTPTPSSHSSPAVGPIVGGTLAGVLGLALIASALFVCWRRRRGSDGIHYATADKAPSDYPIQAADIPYPVQAHVFPQQRERLPTEEASREEISHHLGGPYISERPLPPPPVAQTTVDTVHRENDTAVQSQVENLQREVARLRERVEVTGSDSEAPPQYHSIEA